MKEGKRGGRKLRTAAAGRILKLSLRLTEEKFNIEVSNNHPSSGEKDSLASSRSEASLSHAKPP